MINRNLQSQRDGISSAVSDARGRAVLCAVIKEHLVTGEPVGSRTLAEKFAHAGGWSAATIRNVMSELETAGLVEQPHTSAGRVPTDKGYRFYVNYLLENAPLSLQDQLTINDLMHKTLESDGDTATEIFMERASHALSALSENVGIVISPALADYRLQHIEFLKLSDRRVLVITVSAPNLVRHKTIRLEEDLSQSELENAARYLNVEFNGKSLNAIRAEILEMMRREKARYDRLLRNAMLLCARSMDDEAESAGAVFIGGASNMLAKPDFSDSQAMRELFRTFEEKSRLVKILNECLAQGSLEEAFAAQPVKVVIGSEHSTPSMQACAFISAPYRLEPGGMTLGALGIVGPVRIEYGRAMAVVHYTARFLERMLWADSSASAN